MYKKEFVNILKINYLHVYQQKNVYYFETKKTLLRIKDVFLQNIN